MSKDEIDIPKKFRSYVIDKPISSGSFSCVVTVKDEITNNKYAAKIIPKNQNDRMYMIYNEIEILRKVTHPNIIKLIEIIELINSKNKEYIILIEELCTGGTLLDLINSTGFSSEKEKRSIARSITEAIKYLHDEGIAHCDIKPDNILLTKERVPKLCDFNLSKIVEKTDKTSRGGSEAYEAPELFKFGPVDFLKTDIWSLGITLYAISENKYPYRSVKAMKRGKLRFKTENESLIRFVKRCLVYNPSERASAAELLNDSYLTLDDEDELFRVSKQDSISKLKTSPDLTKAKPTNRQNYQQHQNLLDDDDNELDIQLTGDIIINNNDNCDFPENEVNHQIEEVDIEKDENFTFNVMFELGFDFGLQTEDDENEEDVVDDGIEQSFSTTYEDSEDFEIQQIEDRICDNIFKVKFEKRRKTKKKGAQLKKKDKHSKKISSDSDDDE